MTDVPCVSLWNEHGFSYEIKADNLDEASLALTTRSLVEARERGTGEAVFVNPAFVTKLRMLPQWQPTE